MRQGKLRVGVLFGGRSVEHEISLISAKNVVESMDPKKYEVVLISIDKNGRWHLKNNERFLSHPHSAKHVQLSGDACPVAFLPKALPMSFACYHEQLIGNEIGIDVIFPILHGPLGEDGTVQGLLTLADIPFVGAGVLGSAIGMDKDVMKRLLRDAGIPIGKFMTVYRHQEEQLSFDAVVGKLGLPFFIKPANSGSSVGISKVKSENQFREALKEAFLFAKKVVIEEFISGREIECSVLGNEDPIVSLPGEVIPQHEFYSYEAKYLDENGAQFQIPVHLGEERTSKIQKMAIDAYRALCCEGMGRMDFFMKENGEIFFNEINTIPGFTHISMYPKNWEASGMSYSALIDRLIELALHRHAAEKALHTSFLNNGIVS